MAISCGVSVACSEAAERCSAAMADGTSGVTPRTGEPARPRARRPLGDPPSGSDGAGRGLAGGDGAKAIANDDRDRSRATSGEIFDRAFSVRGFLRSPFVFNVF